METQRPLTLLERWVNRTTWVDGCEIEMELRQAREEGHDLSKLVQTRKQRGR